ncbi:MAG TPA: type II secretion system F family protein [Alphaproteobacteria bacterium]|nr:type II secretion system F family protein [Alphaproteobacteria bacterium]
MSSFLPTNWGPADYVTLLAGVTAFFTVFAVWNTAIARDPMRSRIKALADRREAMRAGFVAPQRRERRTQREKSVGIMRQVVKRMNLMRSQSSQKIVQKLAEAGWRSKDAVVVYLFFKLILPVIVGVAATIILFGVQMFDLQPLTRTAAAIGTIILAAMAPDILIKNTTSKRQAEIRKALPDALDLLVICAEAGLTIDASLSKVAREMARSCDEIADEFSLTAVELGFLTNRRQALENLARRVPVSALRGVVTTLIQTERYGTPLSQSLRVLSAEFRNERLMRAEEKAARLPAILTVPLICFILPALFIVLIGPAILKVMDNFLSLKM